MIKLMKKLIVGEITVLFMLMGFLAYQNKEELRVQMTVKTVKKSDTNQLYKEVSANVDKSKEANENSETEKEATEGQDETSEEKKFIKWVEFNVTAPALNKAYQYDVESQEADVKLDWIEILAFLGAKYGGDFKKYKDKDMESLVEALNNKTETMESLTENMQYYSYYLESYTAVLGGMVGEYEVEVSTEGSIDGQVWEKKYGLKAYLPIAKGFPYNGYDDFGVSRSYGYKRNHLGHDMMGQTGTPIIAVESGYVEAIGWNQYGGWRIGIRSFDKKRYYYYAHLRQNYPFHKSLKEGSIVQAGDVIGYLGRTGYSKKENVNNIDTSHLHMGLQLIFDESQKEGNNEIWVSFYELSKFLQKNRSETVKDLETKEYDRIYGIKDPAVKEMQGG